MSTMFARSEAIFATIHALIQSGVSHSSALLQASAQHYRSRGKGKGGNGGKRVGRGSRGYNYPFSSAKQHRKAQERNYMKTVNGFEIMQTTKRGELVVRGNLQPIVYR